MKWRLERSEDFKADLSNIATYLTAEGGLELAERFLECARKTSFQLREYPESGTVKTFPRAGTIRFIIVDEFPNHLIFYQVIENELCVRLLRVLHGTRNLRAIL